MGNRVGKKCVEKNRIDNSYFRFIPDTIVGHILGWVVREGRCACRRFRDCMIVMPKIMIFYGEKIGSLDRIHLSSVREVSLGSCSVSREMGSTIAKMKNIISLDVSGCKGVCDEMVYLWKGNEKLVKLNMSHCDITGINLDGFKMLRELVVRSCPNLVVKEIGKLVGLERLEVSGLFDGEFIENLVNLRILKMDFENTKKVGKWFDGMNKLEELAIVGAYFNCVVLSKSVRLWKLDLSECLIRGWEELDGCVSLESLRLASSDVREKDLTELAKGRLAVNLKELDISRCFKLYNLGCIGGFRALEYLNVSYVCVCNIDGIFKKLILCHAQLPDGTIRNLLDQGRLEYLDLRWTRLSPCDGISLDKLRNCGEKLVVRGY